MRTGAAVARHPDGVRSAAPRADFPLLAGSPVVYLDSASTTQKPEVVLRAMDRFYRSAHANVHRGVHALSVAATEAYEGARDAVARFVNAPDRRGVVFTRNLTEAANLVAYAWARRVLRPGDELLLTVLEHHSNLVPWQAAARATGATLRFLDLDPETLALDLGGLDRAIGSRTRLVAVTGMSNVTGVIPDLGPLVAAARGVGAHVFLDAAQLAAHRPIDVQTLGVDFLGLSGHKLLGPTGSGALVTRPELLEALDPFLYGGDMVQDVTLESATWNEVPWRFEAGTPAIAEAVGFGAALEYLLGVGWDVIRAHDAALVRHGEAALDAVPGVRRLAPGPGVDRGPVFSFVLDDPDGERIHPHDVGTWLDQQGVAVRVGHLCARPLLRRLGEAAVCRASAGLHTTPEDLDALARALRGARAFYARR